MNIASTAYASSPERPRILFFSPYDLDGVRSGGARRARLFWEILQANYDVRTVVHSREEACASADKRGVRHVRVRWGAQRFFDGRLTRLLGDEIAGFKPDLVWAEHFYSIPMIARVAHSRGIRVIYNSQNVEVERFRAWSPLHRAFIHIYEDRCVRAADAVACVSEADKRLLLRTYGTPEGKTTVLPNGYDEGVFKPAEHGRGVFGKHGIDPSNPVVLFIGNHAYRPNAAALDAIEREIAPRLSRMAPDARVAVAGPGLPEGKRNHSNIHYLGFVDDVVPYLQSADLLICPLKHGGGTRLKIIESLACGLPVLSTDKGAEGLDDIGDESGLYRRPMEVFAESITELLESEKERPRHSPPRLLAYSKAAIEKRTVAFVDSLLSANRGETG